MNVIIIIVNLFRTVVRYFIFWIMVYWDVANGAFCKHCKTI